MMKDNSSSFGMNARGSIFQYGCFIEEIADFFEKKRRGKVVIVAYIHMYAEDDVQCIPVVSASHQQANYGVTICINSS